MSGWLNLAKSALSSAQKRIDHVLDIRSEDESDDADKCVVDTNFPQSPCSSSAPSADVSGPDLQLPIHLLPGAESAGSFAVPTQVANPVVLCPANELENADACSVDVSVRACVDFLVSRVSGDLDESAGLLRGNFVHIPRNNGAAGPKSSECTSPADEAETTLSSDIEMVGTSLDDNGSDRSSDARNANNGDFNGRTGSDVALRALLQRRLLHTSTARNDASVSEIVAVYEKRVTELTERLAIEVNMREQITSEKSKLAEENSRFKSLYQSVKEKEKQIVELLSEGEKLAKRELQQANLIKKLREKEKEQEKAIDKLKDQVKNLNLLKQEVSEWKSQYEAQKKNNDKINEDLDHVQSTVSQFQAQIEDSKIQCNQYKLKIDALVRDNAELTAAKATVEHELQVFKDLNSKSKEAELKERLDTVLLECKNETHALKRQIEQANTIINQNHEEHAMLESSLKWEISQLRQKLQLADMRNQELSEGAADASKPLLKQMESLQSSFRSQQDHWEKVEKLLANAYKTFSEIAERKLLEAEEKNVQSNLAVSEHEKRAAQLETKLTNSATDLSQLRDKLDELQVELERRQQCEKRLMEQMQENARLHQEEMSEERAKCAKLEQCILNYTSSFEAKHQSELDSLKAELLQSAKTVLSLQMELAEERRRFSAEIGRGQTTEEWSDLEVGEANLMPELIRNRLQLLENEINECQQLQQHRDVLATDLITVSQELNSCKSRLAECEGIQENYQSLEEKHQALLQMYGEKLEENESLGLELYDVKAMFRKQVTELLKGEEKT
ncbi:TMF DNA bd and TMF TATA bd domain containing prot ein [Trichuris trichiura]|uniref:TMF DNA bd and TMF TATA bd domain containing prot ein n=1 Tax=Trichuris trichiura TaxID=36087 RepID=A0A077YV83_TRITR|nr:TMF DNA bd and TMF TATA bd domain containing prot ein [Trichuris trichiura]